MAMAEKKFELQQQHLWISFTFFLLVRVSSSSCLCFFKLTSRTQKRVSREEGFKRGSVGT
ncbi:transmembrane protein, putative [Medicago truncatula]|uniref:Transmembrane protein, putative n=1 Tax=Medicago truncatula TaxID=3880 RepID=G7KFT4_MEDTR|nr:transmembrane protein, putative [Medicago truncatula]